MASNQDLRPEAEVGAGPELSIPDFESEELGDNVLYVEDREDLEELSIETMHEELSDMPEDSRFYISPRAFTGLLERKTGQHQTWLYDTPEEERPSQPELPEFVEPGIEEVAELLSELPAESGRIDVVLYERDGNPRYLKTHEGEVSDQVFEKFEHALATRTDYDVEPIGSGYVLEL